MKKIFILMKNHNLMKFLDFFACFPCEEFFVIKLQRTSSSNKEMQPLLSTYVECIYEYQIIFIEFIYEYYIVLVLYRKLFLALSIVSTTYILIEVISFAISSVAPP